MRYLQLIPRPRLLARLLFVFAITAVLAVFGGPAGTASAWSSNGDPTELTTRTDRVSSCSISSTAGAGTVSSGTVVSLYGICYDRTGVTNSVTTWMTDADRSLSDLTAFGVCWSAETCGSSQVRAYKAVYSGIPVLTAFSSTVCPGVADCATYTVTMTMSTNAAWNTFPASGVNARLFVEMPTGSHACTGGNNYCTSGLNGLDQPMFFSQPAFSGSYQPPRYRWGGEFVPPVSNRCEGVQIGVEVSNDALTVADYDDVLYPRSSEPEQDDFVFVATFNDWNMLTDPGGLVLTYQWPNTGWLPITEILDRVALNDGQDSAMTFRLSSVDLRYLSQVQFRCIDTDVEGDLEQRRHLAFWDPGPAVDLPNWTLGALYQSACYALTFTRATGTIQPGQTARVAYNLGGDDGLDLAVFAYGVANFGPTTSPSILAYSTNSLGAATGGPSPFLRYVAPGTGWLVFTLPASVAEPVAYADLVFSCTDDLESGLIIAGSADLGLSGSVVQPEPSCWEQGGMSLTSPASWIAGIARMISCVSQELFVPEGAALLDQVQDMNATVAERPPFIAVAAIVGFADDLSDSFSATSGSGCFTGPSIPGVAASTTSCAGAGIELETGQRSTMALLLTAPMILGLAGHMFGLLRGQSEFITEDNGQMAWRM